jgi:hypothetical protein
VAWQLTLSCDVAAEIRTYQFVVDGSLPYRVSCGECSGPSYGTVADIEGIFKVSLDREAGTGALLSLDDRLVNVFDVLYSGSGVTLEPAEWAGENSGIIPDWQSGSEPPLEGQLTVEGSTLRLISDGRRPLANGGYRWTPPYTIAMTGNQASFRMVAGADDYYITVTDAQALEVITGDFNNDGAVNTADYVVWRKGFGTIYGQFHYDVWLGGGKTAAGSLLVVSVVPEPATIAMLRAAMLFVSLRRRSIRQMPARLARSDTAARDQPSSL